MKEIKFRAWDKAEKRWYDYEDSEIFIDLHGQPLIYTAENPYPFANTDIELMQYTGLKDKNGKEIYEGDAVRCYGGEHCQGHWEFDRTVVITDITDYEVMALLCESEHIEVIGNIHDNPDLLEQSSC